MLLTEKISSLRQSSLTVSMSQTVMGVQDGILVFDTEPLDHIDFSALITQSREEADQILTLNPSHFDRLSAAIARIIEAPTS